MMKDFIKGCLGIIGMLLVIPIISFSFIWYCVWLTTLFSKP